MLVLLQRTARIDVDSPLNSAHIPVAYTRLERLLAHLEALSGALPACYDANIEVYRCTCILGLYLASLIATPATLGCSYCSGCKISCGMEVLLSHSGLLLLQTIRLKWNCCRKSPVLLCWPQCKGRWCGRAAPPGHGALNKASQDRKGWGERRVQIFPSLLSHALLQAPCFLPCSPSGLCLKTMHVGS